MAAVNCGASAQIAASSNNNTKAPVQMVLLKRNSPQWVEKIDSAPYMRRDRFVLVRAQGSGNSSKQQPPHHNNKDMGPVLQLRTSASPSENRRVSDNSQEMISQLQQ